MTVPDELRAEVETLMSRYPDPHSAATGALAAAQRLHGWCSPEAIEQVAAVMRVTPAYLSSLVTFYDMLRAEPTGRRYVYVCTSVACCVRNAKALHDALAAAAAERSGLEDVEIREFECLGACDMAPMASFDGRYVGPILPEEAGEAVDALAEGRTVLPGRGLEDPSSVPPMATPGETRVLLEHVGEPDLHRIDVYERLGGYRALRRALLELEPDDVLRELEASGLRGRGGAGFSMGKKASFIPKGDMDRYLCCNADESEPGTFKDRLLMQRNPHLLIEGIAIGSVAAGANRAFIFVRGEYVHQTRVLEAAVAEAYARGYLGERILGSPHSLELVVHPGAGAYICGEETALLDGLEGKRGNPRLRPPFPANAGLYGKPTLINNVETLCCATLVIGRGAEWFRSLGTEQSTGTKIVSVSGNVRRPGNYEVELGTPARRLVYDLAGGPPEGRRVKCWFPGGSSAPVLLEEHLDLPYSFEDMAAAGSMLGSGAIIVVDDSVPIVHVALRLAEFYRHESCGKCVPCREGTNWTVKMLERIDSGEATPMDLELMAGVQEGIIGNCLCVLGDSMAAPIVSMIRHFRGELEDHIERARQRRQLEELGALSAAEPAGVGSR